MISPKRLPILAAGIALALGAAACGSDDDTATGSEGSSSSAEAASGLSGAIRVDGSSTVGPLTEAVAEKFNEENPDVQITVGQSGTGGGFEKFCAGETQINDASRPIEAEEESLCKKGGVKYDEVQVANDALTVVLNNNNPVTCLSVDQLAQMWGPDDPVSSWADVEGLDAEFDADVDRFGPGTDSGTFDYFTDAVNGEEGVQTKDYNNVGEDDNQTVTGVEGSEGGIGYFGFSYYEENQGSIKAAEIENDAGDCVAPSAEAVQDGSYNPLGRPLFIYPSQEALGDEVTKAFMQYYLDNVNEIAPQVGFISMTDAQLSKAQDTVSALGG